MRIGLVGQLGTRAIFNAAAALQNHNLIGTLDGGQAMGNDDGGAVLQQTIDGFFQQLFRGRIKP